MPLQLFERGRISYNQPLLFFFFIARSMDLVGKGTLYPSYSDLFGKSWSISVTSFSLSRIEGQAPIVYTTLYTLVFSNKMHLLLLPLPYYSFNLFLQSLLSLFRPSWHIVTVWILRYCC